MILYETNEKHIMKNISIAAASAIIIILLVIIPFIFPSSFTNILRGFSGWIIFALLLIVFALLLISLIFYILFTEEKLIYRLVTIPMLTLLMGGYFLYLVFGLEAYKFACSALIFGAGTILVPINIALRLWDKIKEWKMNISLSKK